MTHSFDLDLSSQDVQGLHDATSVAGFFTVLGYETGARITQTAANLGLSDSVQKRISKVELLSDNDRFLQVYLFELKSVTVADIKAIARAFRDKAGNYLFVVTSDYEYVDFVLLDRVGEMKGATAISAAVPALVPRRFTVDRRKPTAVHLRVLRRLTWTESDPFAQFDKLRFAYDLAHWSEVHFNNRGLFSDYYLRERLPARDGKLIEFEEWREDPKAAYQRLRSMYDRATERFGGKKTPELITALYSPMLKELGFNLKQQNGDDGALHLRLEDPTSGALLAVCLPFPWGRELDRKDDTHDTETPEATPVFTVVNLLAKEKTPWVVLTNGKLWRLYSQRAHSRATNYYEVDLDEVLGRQGFQQDIQDSFRYFWLMFRAEAFRAVERTWLGKRQTLSMLDRLLLGSEEYAKELGESLKSRVFTEVFPVLSEGFIASMRQRGDLDLADESLANVYQGTLTLLYRLLFLHAESRDLLPVNSREYYGASLQRLKEEIREAAGAIPEANSSHADVSQERAAKINKSFSASEFGLWKRLKKLFSVIDKGSVESNVPRYNGGLFQAQRDAKDQSAEAQATRFLESENIADRYLALALDLLARDEDRKTRALVFIDYKSLGVRQLGSIYEGLLEFRLRIAGEKLGIAKEKGREVYKPFRELSDREKSKAENQKAYVSRGHAYLENDKRERKATGSYYTPDHIVKYIVEHSVGPVLQQKFDALRPQLRDAQRRRREFTKEQEEFAKRGMKPKPVGQADLIGKELVDELFNVKVLDPAMGSGHFLVEAVDYITDKTLEFLNAFPWNPIVVRLDRMRSTIEDQMEEQNLDIDTKRLTDVNLLKRHVLKRCIYGVDLNPMAVELAKVSLWLDCFTLGAPLSFLDHHLRCGNSLIGSTIAEVDAIREAKGQLTLTGTSDWQGLTQAVQGMVDVGGMPDITSDQVADSKRHFQSALSDVEVFKRVLDLQTARSFVEVDAKSGKKKNKVDIFDELLRSGELFQWARGRVDSPLAHTSLAKLSREVLREMRQIGEQERFFHWELEFPEVFYGRRQGTQNAVERLHHAGFDAVVGNPPYDVMEKERGEESDPHETLAAYLRTVKRFEPALGGKLNLYRPFVILSLYLLHRGGMYSQIIPMSFMGDISVSRTRSHVLTLHKLAGISAFPQKDDESRRVFREAKLSTCIPVVEAKILDNPQIRIATYPFDSFEDRPLTVTVLLNDLREIDPENLPIPACSQADIQLAIKLHRANRRIHDVAEVTRGEINQTTFRNYITSSTKGTKPLLKGVEIRLFGFNIVLSQGEREYFDEREFERKRHDRKPAPSRIATQRISGIDETRRIVCALSTNGAYFADSTNAIVPREGVDATLLLAVLNSSVLNWRFKLTSTNNNVGTNELDVLPFPSDINDRDARELAMLVKRITATAYRKTSDVVASKDYAELDELVCRLFGVSDSESALIAD